MGKSLARFGVLRFVLVVIAITQSNCAFAWGNNGHRITGYIAERLLTSKARVRLNAIIPAADLAVISTWMDENRLDLKRAMPGSDRWHYINQPICANKEYGPICLHGDCAVSRIDAYRRLLASPNASQAEKAFAVRVLVHLVGDLHQPLHAADNGDFGGNDVAIGRGRNSLHSEWDTGLVQRLTRYRSLQSVASAAMLQYGRDILGWQSGSAATWASESHQLAKTFVYGSLPGFSCNTFGIVLDELPNAYVNQAIPVVERQLAKAGARIAYVLNTALAEN